MCYYALRSIVHLNVGRLMSRQIMQVEDVSRVPTYIRGFDGLRAIAAFAVIGFHLQLAGFSLGWAGVYLFFVLSGFLITRILIAAKDKSLYFATFWTHRAIRIFPIYYLLFVSIFILAHTLAWPTSDWPWFALYVQNFKLATSSFAMNFPLMQHTWTLACEEQFYWLWPIAVYFMPRRVLLCFAIGLLFVGLLSRVIAAGFQDNPDIVFAPLPCVVDLLAWGALAAILTQNQKPTSFTAS
jgi:peptidoglycan/LPS O-acetylase OafA/YrhL